MAAIAAAVILVFGIGSIIICNDTPPVSEIPSIGDTPAYFYYQGDYYIYSGEIVFSLPDGFELIHEIENTGDSFNSIDFTGNIDGYVYMSESNKELAYFQWKGWNEEIDGKAPYLVLIKSE